MLMKRTMMMMMMWRRRRVTPLMMIMLMITILRLVMQVGFKFHDWDFFYNPSSRPFLNGP